MTTPSISHYSIETSTPKCSVSFSAIGCWDDEDRRIDSAPAVPAAGSEAPAESRMNCLSVAFLIVGLEVGFGLLGWLIWRLM